MPVIPKRESKSESRRTDDVADPSRDVYAPPSGPRIVRSVLLFTIAGVLLYGVAAAPADYRSVLENLRGFPVQSLAEVILLVVIGWMLRAWRFHYYLRSSGVEIPFSYSVKVFLASFALTGTPGKMGEAVKGIYLKRDYEVPITRVVGILVVERLMDLWGILLLASFSVLLFSEWRSIFLVCAGLVIAGGVFICMERLYRPVLEAVGRLSFLRWISSRVLGVLLTGRHLMTPRLFLAGLVISAIAWAMESIALYITLVGMELPSSLLQANFVYSFSQIVGALSMLPGGIGGAEAGMAGLLAVMGISYAQGLPAIILIRVCTLWLAIFVGIVFMGMMTFSISPHRPITAGPIDAEED